MNIIKAQKDIFNHLLSGDRVMKFFVDEQNTFITPNGFYGFVIPNATLQINADKIPTMHNIELLKAVKEENLCTLTNECKVIYKPCKTYAVKLKHGENEYFINEKFLSFFQNPKFYIGENKIIILTENAPNAANTVVGIIAQIRA